MANYPEEWLKQADYDMATAEYLYKGRRYFYAVYWCHLSIEKAFKGLYEYKRRQRAPRTANLVYILKRIGTGAPQRILRAVVQLNSANMTMRLYDDMEQLQKKYPAAVAKEIVENCKEALKWTKEQCANL